MDLEKMFWESSIEKLQKEQGLIYKIQDQFMEAEKAMTSHIKHEHQSMFHYLINMDKKYTGLTDTQKTLVNLFHQGMSDKEIVKELGGSTSTIRTQRFTFREKAKQAKIFLTLMNMMEENIENDHKDQLVTIHRHATNIDERFAITKKEKEEAISKYFDDCMKLTSFPKKQKRIIIILQIISDKFDGSKKYNEKEVNELIKYFYDDYVTIRRYLIEYGFLDRTPDGKEYWVKK